MRPSSIKHSSGQCKYFAKAGIKDIEEQGEVGGSRVKDPVYTGLLVDLESCYSTLLFQW